ncbi:MAG: ferredoxin-thioredoxin reductase catalytic domain-containing protein [Candidatus Pacearchaeota archaeon]|jgi:ferredoxin-thioredoxin reductase catalytic subunit
MDDILALIEAQKNELKKRFNDHALANNISLNNDSLVVDELIDKLMVRKRKFGDLYCPCRFVTGDETKNKEIICPCIFHLEDINAKGSCLCGLFIN